MKSFSIIMLALACLVGLTNANQIKLMVGMQIDEHNKNAALIPVNTEETIEVLKSKAMIYLCPLKDLEDISKLEAASFSETLENDKTIAHYDLKDGAPVMMKFKE